MKGTRDSFELNAWSLRILRHGECQMSIPFGVLRVTWSELCSHEFLADASTSFAACHDGRTLMTCIRKFQEMISSREHNTRMIITLEEVLEDIEVFPRARVHDVPYSRGMIIRTCIIWSL